MVSHAGVKVELLNTVGFCVLVAFRTQLNMPELIKIESYVTFSTTESISTVDYRQKKVLF